MEFLEPRHYDIIERVVQHHFDDPSDQDDARQVVFLRLLEAKDTLRQDASRAKIKTWVWLIARRAMFSYRRSQQRAAAGAELYEEYAFWELPRFFDHDLVEAIDAKRTFMDPAYQERRRKRQRKIEMDTARSRRLKERRQQAQKMDDLQQRLADLKQQILADLKQQILALG